jgi:HEAT repeat protein
MRIALIAATIGLLVGLGLNHVTAQPARRPDQKQTRGDSSLSTNPSSTSTGPKTHGGKTLEQWKKELTHADASRRALAIIAIVTFGDEAKSAVPMLIDRIKDPDLSPRGKAILALRMITIDDRDVPRVVDALAGRLWKRNEDQAIIRYEAAVSLRRFANDAAPAIPALINGTLDRSCWEIRHMCASTLWRAALGTGKLNKSPEPVKPPTKPVKPVRPVKPVKPVKPLTPAPADSRGLAIKALMDILRNPKETYQTRLEAVHGLGALGKPADSALLQAEIELLSTCTTTRSTENKPLAIWAYASLVVLGNNTVGDDALSAIARHLKPEYSLEIRSQAAQALGALGDRAKSRIGALIAMLNDKEAVAVSGACTALAQIGDKSDKVIDGLLQVAQHKDPYRAAPAIIALVNMKATNTRVLEGLEKVRANKDTHEDLLKLTKHAIDELKKPPVKKAS